MKLSAIDANLLVALDALLKERNVTRAAARLGVGQPALSHSLARLRDHFKDPLLVRSGRELVVSRKAAELAPLVANAAAALSQVFVDAPSFDPSAARRFVLHATDFFCHRFLPEIVGRVQEAAPGFELEVRPFVTSSTASILGEDGDLAFGVFEDLPPELRQVHLFHDPLVCVVRADHPTVGDVLSLDAYAELSHIDVRPAPHVRRGTRVGHLLATRDLPHRVAVRVPYMLVAARLVEASDHVVTVNRSCAAQIAQYARVRVVECPLALPPLWFSLIWDSRFDADPGHRWLREACRRVCGAPHGAP